MRDLGRPIHVLAAGTMLVTVVGCADRETRAGRELCKARIACGWEKYDACEDEHQARDEPCDFPWEEDGD